MLQAIPNAFSQKSMLNPTWFWISVGLIGAIQLAQVVFAWLGKSLVMLYLAMHVSTFAFVALWPQMLAEPNTQAVMPWLWWLLAIGGLNAFGAFKPLPAGVAAVLLHVLWLVMSTTDSYGNRPVNVAVQDTLLAFFFSALLGMLLISLRRTTANIDDELDRRAALAAEAATVRANEAERARMSAIVHDSVLTALLLGANAQTKQDRDTAALAAKSAIKRLSLDELDVVPESLQSQNFFEALAESATLLADDIKIHTDLQDSLTLPGKVVEALTEATLQAVTNSVRHAGTVRHRELRLNGTSQRIKIVIKDDGRGFRESRVSRSRLGLRLSIRDRVQSIGGRVAIQSEPGRGCTVAITWASNDGCEPGDEVNA